MNIYLLYLNLTKREKFYIFRLYSYIIRFTHICKTRLKIQSFKFPNFFLKVKIELFLENNYHHYKMTSISLEFYDMCLFILG